MDGLLERDRELAALERLLADAHAGGGRLALVEGPAGIGKSRLLAEVRRRAAGTMTVLAARCSELELAEARGCPPLVETARSELYAAGARPRTTALAGVRALTASEPRVAALAAAGQTNRAIAQALFVTPKTVEVHLSNAYRKLGIRSRRELPAALA